MNIKIIKKQEETNQSYNIVNLKNIDYIKVSNQGNLIELKKGLNVVAVINSSMNVYSIDTLSDADPSLVDFDALPVFLQRHLGN
jgi:hypothetical protein